MKKIWDHLEEIIVVIAMVVMLALTFANVVSRYVLHASIAFTDEVTSNLFVFLTTMGAAVAAKRGAHLGLTIITDRLPVRWQALANVFGGLCGAVFAGFCIYTGVKMCMNNMANGAVSLSLQIPQVIWSAQLPIGMFFVGVRFLEAAFNNLKIVRGAMDTAASETEKT